VAALLQRGGNMPVAGPAGTVLGLRPMPPSGYGSGHIRPRGRAL
jgi:hypothetical protein